jgi:integrase
MADIQHTSATVVTLPRKTAERIKLTTTRVDALKPRATIYYVYDTEQPGLTVRVMPTAVKTYVYYRKTAGRPERVSLGKVGALGLDAARKAAAQLEGHRAAGRNPAQERRAARVKGQTLATLFTSWKRAAVTKGLRSADADERLWKLHLEKRLGARVAAELTTTDVENAIHKIGTKHPRTANKAHSLVRRIYNHAAKKGVVTDNPAKGVTRFAEVVRDRVLSKDEIAAFLAAVDLEQEPWRSYFKILLLTGARRGAVAAMRWGDLDLDAAVWTVPAWASKNKKATAIALVPAAVDVLTGIDKLDDTWVFPAVSESGHIETPTKAWRRISERAALEGVRIHDIRRTLGTALAVAGASSHLIAKALGHKSLASAAAYVHLDVEAARAALEGVTGGWKS